MTNNGILQIVLYLFTLLIFVKPLGWYMARVYEAKPCGLDRIIGPFERLTYRVCGIDAKHDMSWKSYLTAMLLFNFLGFGAVYIIGRMQSFLPLNPQNFPAVSADLAFNIASGFTTTADWQAYGGENTLSYFSQMTALTVQNFLAAATGMSLLIALIRGITRQESSGLGNFWVDTVRGVFYILLPLAFIFAMLLVPQGVIQNFKGYQTINLLQPLTYDGSSATTGHPSAKPETHTVTTQVLPMGPAASQVAIMELGGNGGGFFNANAAHPFENPTPLANFFEMIAILLIPAALCYTFGAMVNDKKQGWVILIAMLLIFIPWTSLAVVAEQSGNPGLTQFGIDQADHNNVASGGNMEGKETRFGIVNSALWAGATTASGNGSYNAMLDSFTPLGLLVPLGFMDLGEVVFGGVGSGLYGMLLFVIITVFVAGLMVGRTPEYLGKKIEPYEMKMAAFAILVMPLVVLLFTAIAVMTQLGTDSIGNPGSHGFTEILYTFTSLANNNGSSVGGLNTNTVFYNTLGGITMLIGRYWIAIATIAIAGSMARKRMVPVSLGTLPTYTPLFVILLIGVTVIVGALTFFPALSLGPIVEQLMLHQ